MTREQIEACIPHRDPFLMIDEIVSQTDDHIVCRKTFQPDAWFFRGHYPHFPLTPGVLLCEAAMQAGAVMLSKLVNGAEQIPVATRMGDVKFKKIVRPGDTIEIDVRLTDRLADAFYMTGKITVDGKLAARLDFACSVMPKP
jgi:3-hydroxyacyl-[acyl-carrier-protein] dehydratase